MRRKRRRKRMMMMMMMTMPNRIISNKQKQNVLMQPTETRI